MVWQMLTLAMAERLMLTQRKVGGFGHSRKKILYIEAGLNINHRYGKYPNTTHSEPLLLI